MEDENDHDDNFGVRPSLFDLIAEAGSAADEGETQVHPCDGADVSQRWACVYRICLSESIFIGPETRNAPKCRMSPQKINKIKIKIAMRDRPDFGVEKKAKKKIILTYIQQLHAIHEQLTRDRI